MYQGMRGRDDDFPETEILYLRCYTDCLEANGEYDPAKIRLPKQSVNRRKHSWFCDVLLPNEDAISQLWLFMGVVSFRKSCLTFETANESKPPAEFRFGVEHDPLISNYGHAELRCWRDGHRFDGSISQSVKKQCRTLLARARFKLVLRPLMHSREYIEAKKRRDNSNIVGM